MAKQTLKQAAARPARTAIQAAPAYGVIEFVDAFVFDMNERQFAAAVVLLTLVFGYLQVIVENAKGVALFRKIPEAPAPIVDEANEPDNYSPPPMAVDEQPDAKEQWD